MIEQICAYIHNFFDRDEHRNYWHLASGTFTVSGGTLELSFLQPGQYFRIQGSVFNDGVFQYPATDLQDETFMGTITAMHVPRDFLALVTEIAEWQSKYGDAALGPYQSESFGGYSYTLASGSGKDGSSKNPGWQLTFASRLNQYRKLA